MKNKNHKLKAIKEVSYMIDQAFCTCGWKSSTYFDGAEYAEDEWKKHAGKQTRFQP